MVHKLSAVSLKQLPKGKHCDGGGLWLYKTSKESGKWVFRYTLWKKRREMGLGAAELVTLKEARTQAAHWRGVVRKGLDPINERDRAKRESAEHLPRLAEIAESAYAARQASLKGEGKAGRWFSPLKLHVLPKIGNKPIEQISQRDIETALRPIWKQKPETARKAMNRLGLVMKHGAAMGLAGCGPAGHHEGQRASGSTGQQEHAYPGHAMARGASALCRAR